MFRGLFAGLAFVGLSLGFSVQTSALPVDLPASEISIIDNVADHYGLEGESRILLFVIRKVENGRAGYAEFGVLHPHAVGRGFRVQCEWAAGTIKKRFTGDLRAFADRWCPPSAHPLNRNWYKNASFYMNKYLTGE